VQDCTSGQLVFAPIPGLGPFGVFDDDDLICQYDQDVIVAENPCTDSEIVPANEDASELKLTFSCPVG